VARTFGTLRIKSITTSTKNSASPLLKQRIQHISDLGPCEGWAEGALAPPPHFLVTLKKDNEKVENSLVSYSQLGRVNQYLVFPR